MRLLAGERHGDPQHDMVGAGAQPHQLPGAGEIHWQVGDGNVFDQQPEQPFVELVREVELLEAPAGSEPVPRDQEQHRFAARGRLVEGALPALAGRYAAVRIDIEENIVPAFTLQPVAKCDCLGVVHARMAQKNARHGNRPEGTPSVSSVKMQVGIVTMVSQQSVTQGRAKPRIAPWRHFSAGPTIRGEAKSERLFREMTGSELPVLCGLVQRTSTKNERAFRRPASRRISQPRCVNATDAMLKFPPRSRSTSFSVRYSRVRYWAFHRRAKLPTRRHIKSAR